MKKKVTLIYPGAPASGNIVSRTASLRLPLSILYLARPLLDLGYEVKVVDTRVTPLDVEDVADSVCAGISSMTGIQILHGIAAAQAIRARFPDMPLVWGGIHPTFFPEQTVESGHADIVVRHEGDVTFPELVEALRTGGRGDDVLAQVEGITWRSGDGSIRSTPNRHPADMDQVGLPAYELVDVDRYFNIRDTFDYQSSRGCPFRCGFCYNKRFNFGRWRPKSADKVIDEMTYLHRTYGVRCFSTVDDEFFIKADRSGAIAEGLLAYGRKFEWSGFCRFDTFSRFDDALISTIKASGVDQMFFGAESGNVDTLKMVKKCITLDQVQTTIARTRQFGIRPVVSFVTGFPGESEETLSDTLALYDRIMALNPASEINGIFIYTPYPGADLYSTAVEHGFVPPASLEEWGRWNFNYDVGHPWLSPRMVSAIRTIAAIARFRFFSKEFVGRNRRRPGLVKAFSVLNAPMEFLADLRWNRRWWAAPYEWRLWGWAVKKVLGTL